MATKKTITKAKAKPKAVKETKKAPAAKKAAVKKEKPLKEKKKIVFLTEYNPRYATCIAGFILVAISLIFEAIAYLNVAYHNGDYESSIALFQILKWVNIVAGFSLLAVSAYGFHKNVYAESLFFVIYALLILVVSLNPDAADLTPEADRAIDLISGALVLIPMLIFLYKRKFMLSIAVLAYALGCFITEMCNAPADDTVYGICAVITAAILIYIAIAYLVRSETGQKMPLI